ncbi:MAG: hypothetical protein ACLQVY_01360 [Limisphaerales bacterium]
MPEIIGTAGHTVAIEVASANQAEADTRSGASNKRPTVWSTAFRASCVTGPTIIYSAARADRGS